MTQLMNIYDIKHLSLKFRPNEITQNRIYEGVGRLTIIGREHLLVHRILWDYIERFGVLAPNGIWIRGILMPIMRSTTRTRHALIWLDTAFEPNIVQRLDGGWERQEIVAPWPPFVITMTGDADPNAASTEVATGTAEAVASTPVSAQQALPKQAQAPKHAQQARAKQIRRSSDESRRLFRRRRHRSL